MKPKSIWSERFSQVRRVPSPRGRASGSSSFRFSCVHCEFHSLILIDIYNGRFMTSTCTNSHTEFSDIIASRLIDVLGRNTPNDPRVGPSVFT